MYVCVYVIESLGQCQIVRSGHLQRMASRNLCLVVFLRIETLHITSESLNEESPYTGFTICSTTYVLKHHNKSLISRLHMYLLISSQVKS